jgi:signal transduction histidine kinase
MSQDFDILVVDDDVGVASNLKDILEAEGYAAAVAHGGQSALTLCRERVVKLALIDIKLPDMSGMELIDKLIELTLDTSYIIITGYASLGSAIEAVRQKRIVGYVTKPLDIDHLLSIIGQVLARKQAEERLKRHSDALEMVILTQELGRRKWALAVHDGITHSLGNIYYRLQAYRKLVAKDTQEAQQDLNEIEEFVLEAIAECKGMIDDLRPPILDDIGLVPAVEKYLNGIRRENDCHVTFKVKGKIPRLSSEIETSVYRIFQEALLNVRKHTRATEVKVTLGSKGNRLVVEVADNGCGFDVEAIDAEGDNWGLIGMRERAEVIGGSLQIKTTMGQGTSVHLEVPILNSRR